MCPALRQAAGQKQPYKREEHHAKAPDYDNIIYYSAFYIFFARSIGNLKCPPVNIIRKHQKNHACTKDAKHHRLPVHQPGISSPLTDRQAQIHGQKRYHTDRDIIGIPKQAIEDGWLCYQIITTDTQDKQQDQEGGASIQNMAQPVIQDFIF